MVCVRTLSESDNEFQRFGHMKFPRWPPAAILDLIQPEMGPFDARRPRKPHPRTKHEGDRLTRCRDGHLKFSQNV